LRRSNSKRNIAVPTPTRFVSTTGKIAVNFRCQGPWNVDLRTPPGPEGSNGSLLDICRGHPGLFLMKNAKVKIKNDGPDDGCHFSFFIFHF